MVRNMKELSPRVLYVSHDDSSATYQSITKASEVAGDGDQIIVGPGTYSSKFTNDEKKEKFPIYIPPHCQLIGSGADTCKIDGKGAMKTASRPVNPYECLILLGDETSLSGFTILNSGANGVSNEQGARILLSNNVLRDNGQHGLLIFGTNNAVIQKNQFTNNGTKKEKYRPPRSTTAGRQGHQIFIESRIDAKNNVIIIDNIMNKTFADGIAIDIFDQPDGAEMHVQVIGNTISNCGRNGFSMAGSYGPSNSNVFIEIRNNQILKTTKTAIDLQSAYSLIFRTISNSKMFMNIVENEIKDCNLGIDAYGAFSPSQNCYLKCNIIGNNITQTKDYGIRAIGGYGMDDWPVEGTRFDATIANNKIHKTGNTAIFVQGGSVFESNAKLVRNNELFLHIIGNQVGKPEQIIVNDGLPTNHVIVLEKSQPHKRVVKNIP